MPTSLLCGPLAHNEHDMSQLIKFTAFKAKTALRSTGRWSKLGLEKPTSPRSPDGLMGDVNCGSALRGSVVNTCQHLLMGMKLWGQNAKWNQKEEISVKWELKQCQ